MSEATRQLLTVERFYAWLVGQDNKHELVDGVPVMMAGANRRHDRVVINAMRIIGNQLRGKTCQPFSSDTYIRIPSGNRRLPDLGVDCGPMEDDSIEASDPKLVVEVTSASTRTFDRTEKLEEYKTIGGLEYILHVDTNVPQVRLYWRDGSRAWATGKIAGLEAVVELPVLGLALSLSELYEGLTFVPRPTLVASGDPASRLEI
jgi:Uma2 family endonuclease